MDNSLYKVTFEGIISDNHPIDEVKETLRKRFKLDENKIKKMFSGEKIILKSGIDGLKADKYINTFINAGLICNKEIFSFKNEHFNKNDSVSEDLPKSEPEGNVVNEEENLTVMNVKSIIGLTETPLKTVNPPIVYSETCSSSEQNPNSVKDKFPEKTGKYNNFSGGINENNTFNDKNISLKSEPVRQDKEILYDDERYRIIFSGILKSGKSADEVKLAFQNIYGIERDDIEILFHKRKLVLKDNVKKTIALQYIELLDEAGAEAEMISIDSEFGGNIVVPSNSTDLKEGVIANENAKMELKKIEEKIEEVKKYRNEWLSVLAEHKARLRDAMSVRFSRNRKLERIKAHNLRVRLNNTLENYNRAAEDLTINTRISMAIPKGILMGLTSKMLPDLVKDSEKDSFYFSLMQKSDIEKLNIDNPHIKDMLVTIMKFNQIDKKIETVRENAYKDFSQESN